MAEEESGEISHCSCLSSILFMNEIVGNIWVEGKDFVSDPAKDVVFETGSFW